MFSLGAERYKLLWFKKPRDLNTELWSNLTDFFYKATQLSLKIKRYR